MIAPKAGAAVTVDGTLAPGADAGTCGTLTLGSADQSTTLTLNGVLALDISADACDRVDVLGDVTAAASASIAVTATEESLWHTRRGEEIPVLTWTGSWTGDVPTTAALPEGWKVRFDAAAKTVYLSYASPGTLIRLM
jgi:hypothetical protein